MANRPGGSTYIGCTTELIQRVWQHKQGTFDGFTKKYNLHQLVWFEEHGSLETATLKERRMKVWKKAWKHKLIGTENPDWRDLSDDFF